MKLIIGLGNPGKEYNNTRHNIGFNFIDKYAEYHKTAIEKKKFNGLYVEILINSEKVLLLKPQSYMNLSGIVVKKYIDFYKIKIEDILVISDDLDMPLGKVKLRKNGSSGGHNGLKNIEENIKTPEYKRLKIGISNDKNQETKDYVLGNFNKDEKSIIEELSNITINIINDFLIEDFECLMAKYNRK